MEDSTRENPHFHFSKLSYIHVTDHPGKSLDSEVLAVKKVKEQALVALDLCRLSFCHQTGIWNGFRVRSSE